MPTCRLRDSAGSSPPALYAAIGLIVMKAGYAWIERLMPPVVTGAIVAVIGLNLAPIAVKSIAGSTFDTWIGIATIVAVGLVAVRARGFAGRLPILLGGLAGYLLYALLANGFGLGKPIDFASVAAAPGSACRDSRRRCGMRRRSL